MEFKSQIEKVIESYKHFLRDLNGDNVFEKILSTSVEFTGSDRASIFIDPKYNSEGGTQSLKSIVSTGLKNRKIVVDVEHGIVGHVFQSRASYVCQDVSHDPYFYAGVDKQTGYVTKSTIAVPLWFRDDRPIGVLQILNKQRGEFTDGDRLVVELISFYATMALDYLTNLEQLQDSENVLEHTRGLWGRRLQDVVLRSTHPELQKVYEALPSYAVSDASLLVCGESGTGKEVISKLIHQYSRRNKGPLVAINCAAIPESLFEAELFGVAKGAATGTVARKGQVERAHKGTLFLDEIGEMPLDLQGKLLRVLQDHKVNRVGSDGDGIEVDFRLICATNKDLLSLVKQGKFREDLYYRINVVEIALPPLRERKGDLPDISRSILSQLSLKRGWKIKSLSEGAINKLVGYDWPGNIRELQNRLEHACIVTRSEQLKPEDLQIPEKVAPTNNVSYLKNNESESLFHLPLREAKAQFEFQMVEQCLKRCHGNKTEAARLLGLTREGLRKILLRNEAA
jgi:transcriptional regulator with GAF, ATPase, and Fis domain